MRACYTVSHWNLYIPHPTSPPRISSATASPHCTRDYPISYADPPQASLDAHLPTCATPTTAQHRHTTQETAFTTTETLHLRSPQLLHAPLNAAGLAACSDSSILRLRRPHSGDLIPRNSIPLRIHLDCASLAELAYAGLHTHSKWGTARPRTPARTTKAAEAASPPLQLGPLHKPTMTGS